MSARDDVLIIGGGVIGAACAMELAARGKNVTLIDKGEVGYGCSYGNAGWITPSFAVPLPMPGMLLKSTKWLLDPNSPLYIKPRFSLDLCRWLLRFVRSMNRPLMTESTRALTELALYSLEAYRKLDQEIPGDFGFSQQGLIVVAATPQGLADAKHHMELVGAHGVEGRLLSCDEVRELEPAITSPQIAGGVFYPNEAHVEPLLTVQAMIRRAENLGAKIVPNAEVFEFVCDGQEVRTVRTTRGDFSADQYVLATGAWSKPLGRMLGLRVPVLSGKGYAVIVEPFSPKPSRPIELMEKRVVVTPRDDSVRLAGTLELVNLDDSITTRRVQNILRGARAFMNVPKHPTIVETWRGLRPCTPDGVPIIGQSPRWRNLFINTGHQMLGLLAAPGSARLLADLVCEVEPEFDPHPFRASRF